MRKYLIKSFILIIFPCLFEGGARAASDEYLHDFERRSDLEAWSPYAEGAGCRLSNPGSAGNLGGYLQIACGGQFVGAWTRSSDFTGDLSNSRWILGFDVANFGAQQADRIDIVFFAAETAWVYFGTLGSAANGAWTSYGITFDPAWTDDEARANFWVPVVAEGTTAASWATTLKRVEAVGIRTSIGAATDASSVKLGIDNVRLSALP